MLKVRGLGHVLGPLKHHVLEKMSKARAAFALVARAHVVINSYRDYGHRMIFIQDDSQSVIESELFDGGDWNLESFLHSAGSNPKTARRG